MIEPNAPIVEAPAPPAAAQPPVAPPSQPPVAQEPSAPPSKPYAEMTKPELVQALFPDNPNPSPMDIAQRLFEEAQKSGTAVTAKGEPAGPDPTALAEAARQTPQQYRKTAPDANYRAIKEGNAEPNTGSPTYEAFYRANKVSPVAKALLDNGVTYGDMAKLTPTEIQSYADQLSRATAAEGGEHPGNPFSKLSIDELLGELRRAEEAVKAPQGEK